MDAQHKGAAAGGGGGVEVRRINVVYFLSRGGRTDHPHLFRVNHLNRFGAGVRLRDVKRWLSELRGKDMPDNYSWSYKRKYKAGYVWQDLKEDDLITPVSDNEYVLKGCDVRATPPPPCVQAPRRTCSLGEKKREGEEEAEVRTPCNGDQNRPVEVVLTPDSDESSPKPPPPADRDSPGGCESARHSTVPFKVDKPQGGLDEEKQQEQVVVTIEVSRSQSRRQQKHEDDDDDEAATEKTDTTKAAEEPPPQGEGAAGGGGVRGHAHTHAHAVGKQARRMRVARALHSMLTCARADADDAALRPLARRRDGDDWTPPPTTTCPGMEGCGLRSVSRKAARPRKGGGGKDKQQQQRKRDGEKKHDAHKPATLPRCSQCGKEFKPQELHSHMQSCRGFRERMRSSTRPGADSDRWRKWPTASGRNSSESERPSSASAVFLLTES